MLESSSSASAAPGAAEDVGGRQPRPFGRLRSIPPDRHALAAGAAFEPEAGVEGQIGPIDFSAKAFVGPHATFYDDRWRWMEWRGHPHSWNAAAALGFGAWFAYRRMYRYAGLSVVWLALLLGLGAAGAPIRLVGGLHLALAIGLGVYGNALYQQHFRARAREIARRHQGYAERVAALREAGGVNPWAASVAVGGLIAVVLGFIGLPATVGLDLDWTW